MHHSESHRSHRNVSAVRWQSFPIPVFILTLIGLSIFLHTPSLLTTDPGRGDVATDPAGDDADTDGLMELSIEELIEVPIASAFNHSDGAMDDLMDMSIEELMEVTVTATDDQARKAADLATLASLFAEYDSPLRYSR